MKKIALLKKRQLHHAVGQVVRYLILGIAGIISLFAFQAYRSARSSLTRIKAFSDKVVENMPAGLITVNTALEITTHNAMAIQTLGLGENLPLELPREMMELARHMASNPDTLTRELACRCGQGDTVLLDVSASPIRGEEKEITGFLFLFRDLTELADLKQEIERSRRLAAVGKLAAGVAHEIRNPLSSIKGFATYFKERYKDVEGDGRTADIMVQEVERLNRSVTQLLEFAKPVSVVARKVPLKDLIDHSVKLVTHDLSQHNIHIKTDILTPMEWVTTDPDRVNQILLNLYLNAIQAMEKGGNLHVIVSETRKGRAIAIEVKDTGKGISPEDLEHIFDPYFTTRSDGTGLGLAMVHSAVEAMGCEIFVSSQEGEGTQFILTIPVTGESAWPEQET